jgi:hypothetical protein
MDYGISLEKLTLYNLEQLYASSDVVRSDKNYSKIRNIVMIRTVIR